MPILCAYAYKPRPVMSAVAPAVIVTDDSLPSKQQQRFLSPLALDTIFIQTRSGPHFCENIHTNACTSITRSFLPNMNHAVPHSQLLAVERDGVTFRRIFEDRKCVEVSVERLQARAIGFFPPLFPVWSQKMLIRGALYSCQVLSLGKPLKAQWLCADFGWP